MTLPQFEWSRVLSGAVVPVVVISACGLLCSALYNRYTAVVSRARAFHRERRLEEDPELLGMLELQSHRILRRAQQVRAALVCMLVCILFQFLCSLCAGLSSAFPSLLTVAAVLFGTGIVIAIVGIVFAILEVTAALDPLIAESDFLKDWVARTRAQPEPGP